MVKKYAPGRGDVVWITFSPTKGHEQSGKRPALVVSAKSYNTKTGLALMCPITSTAKGYPFEVQVRSAKIKGVVLSDQIRTIDWKARNATFIAKVSSSVVKRVRERIGLLIT